MNTEDNTYIEDEFKQKWIVARYLIAIGNFGFKDVTYMIHSIIQRNINVGKIK